MTKLHTARVAAAMLCALILGLVSCSGGGGDDGGSGNGGGGGGGSGTSPPPPPPQGPPPPTPLPPPPQPGVTRPTLYIERDPDGTAYIRVEEQVFNPFLPAGPQRIIANRVMGPSPGENYEVTGAQTTLLSNIDQVRMKHGMQLMESALTMIYDFTYDTFDGSTSIHGAAIKLGDNSRPTNGETYVQRVFADGKQVPDSTYQVNNTDFIGIEIESGPIYVRDVTGRNFGDGGIDSKSGPMYVMNATMGNVNRVVRAWQNVEITLVNSIVNAAPGHSQVWIKNATASVRHYNTLWCRDAANPSPTDPNCSSSPQFIEGEDISATAARARVFALTNNPLPATHPFFATAIDKIVVEYSTDGAISWQPLNLINVGENGVGPQGDTRYRLPVNLNDNNYYFRARYENDGLPVGSTSAVIFETGEVMP